MPSDGEGGSAWEGPEGRRHQLIYRQLRHLGDTSRWWAAACKFMRDPALPAGSHMAFHALRELNGNLLELLVPIASPAETRYLTEERERVAKVLEDADFDKEVIRAAQDRLTPKEKKKIAAVCRLLDLDPDIEETWGNLGLPDLAHRRNLGMRAITDPDVSAAFNEATRVIEAVADRWTRHFPAWADLVEEIAAGDPTNANASRLLRYVPPIYVLLRKFFDSVSDPAWLSKLASRGLITRIPAPELSEDGSTIRYLPWPAANYLAAVASAEPAAVYDALAEVAGSENPVALHDVIKVAAKLPTDYAARLVILIGQGVARWRGVRRHPQLIANLLDALVRGGAPGEAIDLAERMIALDGAGHVGRDHPQEYGRLVGEVVQALGPLGTAEVLAVLVHVLGGASGDTAERSIVWLRRMDEPIRFSNDCRPVLVQAVLELAAPAAVREGEQVLRQLIATGVPVAQRAALHLARVESSVDPRIVFAEMEGFVNEELRVELGQLVRDRWDDLNEQQNRYLAFVADGPPVERLATAEDAGALARRWRGFYLQPVLDKLDRSDPTVAGLLDSADVPGHDVLAPGGIRVRVGVHDAPWTVEEARALDVDELVDRIGSFVPGPGGPGSPSWRGIGELVAQVVATDVAKSLTLLSTVARQAPELLYGIVEGVHLAARRDRIDWDVLIDSALAAARWSGVAGGGWDDLVEPQRALRGQALAAIAVCLRRDDPVPERVIGPILEVVGSCLGDPDPPAESPWLTVGPVGDLPLTVRNQAFATLINLVSALARSGHDVSTVGGVLAGALRNEANPYVFAEAASAVHQLAVHAPDWLRDHITVIFGPPGSSDPRHLVAWQVLSYRHPERIVAKLLLEHYASWVDGLSGELDEPGVNIAGHIGVLAVAGLLDRSTIERFFAVATLQGRVAALSNAVPTSEGEVEASVTLWEWRAEVVESGGDPDELTAVNSWMRSELLEAGWLLEQAGRATRLGVRLGRPDPVLHYLSKLGAEAPESAEVVLDILDRVLAQADLHQLAGSVGTVVGIINRVAGNRPDLTDRVAAARASASLWLEDPLLFAGRDVGAG